MNRPLITLLLWGLCALTANAFSDSDARRMAISFYDNLNKVSESIYKTGGQQSNEAIEAQDAASRLCYDSANLPNEFYQLHLISLNHPFIQASSYVGFLWDVSSTKRIRFDATVESVEALGEQKIAKSENNVNFYDVQVTKRIYINEKLSRTYNDLMRICCETGKIVEITNESGGGTGESFIAIRGRAAKLFSQKRYTEAYNTYLQALQKNDDDAQTNYYLGLMTYFNNKGCCSSRFSKRSTRVKKSLEYLDKAVRNGRYADFGSYAEYARYYILNGGGSV